MMEPRLAGCTIVDHPLIKSKVTILRNKETPTELFRRTLHEVTALLAFEATRDLEVAEIDIETPLERCKGHKLSKGLTVVPILRAGLGNGRSNVGSPSGGKARPCGHLQK